MEEQSAVISDRESSVRSSVDTMYRTTISFNNYHRDEPQICVCLECCRYVVHILVDCLINAYSFEIPVYPTSLGAVKILQDHYGLL